MSSLVPQNDREKLRVAVVSSLFGMDGGGAGLVVQWLAQSLAERGVSTLMVTIPNKRAPSCLPGAAYEMAYVSPPNLYSIHEKDKKPTWLRALWQTLDIWNPGAFHQLRQVLTEYRPDVVHIHKLRGFSPAVWHAAVVSGVSAVVQTCQDYEVMSPEGTLTGTLGRLAKERHWSLRPYQAMRGAWSRKVDTVTAPSQFTLSTIVDAGFFRNVPAKVIPNSNGFDRQALAQLHSAPRQQPTGPLRLLYLGRLVSNKGVDLLCRAVTSAHGDMLLDVAGWGPEESKLSAAWSSSSRIVFHGAVSGPAKHILLERCDALVVPSVWPEVFGMVTTEALAFGKPTIASHVGGIPEVICDGESGLLVPPNDLEVLTSLLSRLAREPEILRRMHPACFNRAKNFSTDSVAEQYLDLYDELLAYPVSDGR